MCAVTKVANASRLVTATLSLAFRQLICVVKINYTKRKGAEVTSWRVLNKKQKENKEQQKTTNKTKDNKHWTWLKVVKLK